MCIVFDGIKKSKLLYGFALLKLHKRMGGGEMNLVEVECPLSFSTGKDKTIVSLP